jgi:hypothetical protein
MTDALPMLEGAARCAQGLEMQIDAHVIVTEAPSGFGFAEKVVTLRVFNAHILSALKWNGNVFDCIHFDISLKN